jgi:hypothetical protein
VPLTLCQRRTPNNNDVSRAIPSAIVRWLPIALAPMHVPLFLSRLAAIGVMQFNDDNIPPDENAHRHTVAMNALHSACL